MYLLTCPNYLVHFIVFCISLVSRPLLFPQRWVYYITSATLGKEGSGNSCIVFVCKWNAIEREVT